MSERLNQAQKKLASWQPSVNARYKPRYHLSVPAGWLNDPNGFGFFQGKCHLFYQYHPYDTVWGPMHWGHWSSEDMISWKQEPVAMAPDCTFDERGCFSGTAIEDGGRYCIMYTGVCEETPGGKTFQQQCLAYCEDGVHVVKAKENPVVGHELLPNGANPYEFRDPKLEKTDSGYRLIVAVQMDGEGKLLSFSSGDLIKWTYDGVYADGFGEMSECPDCFELDGQRVLIVSVIGCGDESLVLPQPVVYVIGREENGIFHAHTAMRDIDRGLDFYAPQTCLAPDGRRLLIGWAHAWGCEMPTHRLGHGWTGTMTLIRECFVRNDSLYQLPAREIEQRRGKACIQGNLTIGGRTALAQCAGACREMILDVDMRAADSFAVRLMETGEECVVLTCDKRKGTLTIDRGASGHSFAKDGERDTRTCATADVSLPGDRLSLRIFVDVSIIEVYVNGGEKVLTCQAFPKGGAYGVSAAAEGEAVITRLESYELV
ncbi:MAG: glycoside hydrolase family 32 protein [Clostridia bacterium]|nr:glycoside hydrolase family 32 protein [Clostridia bacterium]